ncbi:MAG: hypothetical protein WCO56_07310 [Verrucomicrobiota bacterium]
MNDIDSLFEDIQPARKKKRADNTVITVTDCDRSSELAEINDELIARFQTKPKLLILKFLGINEMNLDSALVLHETLKHRPPDMKLVTDACSPIIGPGVLIWLLGDVRRIRPTAWIFFRGPRSHRERGHRPPWREAGEWWQQQEDTTTPDLREIDYHTLLRLINDYLPVKLLAGKPLTPHILGEYCLLGDEPTGKLTGDQVTGVAAAKKTSPPEPKVNSQPSPNRHNP